MEGREGMAVAADMMVADRVAAGLGGLEGGVGVEGAYVEAGRALGETVWGLEMVQDSSGAGDEEAFLGGEEGGVGDEVEGSDAGTAEARVEVAGLVAVEGADGAEVRAAADRHARDSRESSVQQCTHIRLHNSPSRRGRRKPGRTTACSGCKSLRSCMRAAGSTRGQ